VSFVICFDACQVRPSIQCGARRHRFRGPVE